MAHVTHTMWNSNRWNIPRSTTQPLNISFPQWLQDRMCLPWRAQGEYIFVNVTVVQTLHAWLAQVPIRPPQGSSKVRPGTRTQNTHGQKWYNFRTHSTVSNNVCRCHPARAWLSFWWPFQPLAHNDILKARRKQPSVWPGVFPIHSSFDPMFSHSWASVVGWLRVCNLIHRYLTESGGAKGLKRKGP